MDLNTIVSGLVAGSLYALVAVSLNMLYRPTNVFNFAQGEIVMIGAMTAATALGGGLPLPVAMVIGCASGAIVGALEERLAVMPVLRNSQHSAGWVISTLAVSLIITNLAVHLWGPDPVPLPPIWPFSVQTLPISGVRLSSYQIAVVVFTIAVVFVVERFYRTREGLAILAIAEDRDAALLRGIDPDRLRLWSFALGGGLAALAGIVAAPILYASTGLGPLLLLKGFEAAAVGGIGSNKGSLIAAYILGLSEAIGSNLLSPGYQQASTFVIFLVILLIRPQGLFGTVEARRV